VLCQFLEEPRTREVLLQCSSHFSVSTEPDEVSLVHDASCQLLFGFKGCF